MLVMPEISVFANFESIVAEKSVPRFVVIFELMREQAEGVLMKNGDPMADWNGK